MLDALELVRCGLDARRNHDVLMAQRLEASIYITVDTLKYLKKGGRVTAAGAAIGTVLGINGVTHQFDRRYSPCTADLAGGEIRLQ